MSSRHQEALIDRFQTIRRRTEALSAPLSPEDQVLQSMPDCSPTKWHRAHTTWFFEEFVLTPRGVAPVDSSYRFLFNSYYESVGPRHSRPHRGLLSRPSVEEIGAYRARVDERVVDCIAASHELEPLAQLIELGLQHEEQHQELLLTDILHAFSQNPLKPAYAQTARDDERATRTVRMHERAAGTARTYRQFDGGVVRIGHEGSGFAFDNESPRHRVFLEPFELGSHLVTVGEVLAFIRDGGYRDSSLWLSAGIEWARRNEIEAPAYFRVEEDHAVIFGLTGERIADPDEPVLFVSYYEADAIARYLGARLPTEAEWEHVASAQPCEGHFLGGSFVPVASKNDTRNQLYGTGWEWTASSYEAYPGYRPETGALGEYNGKFMVNQQVLRGGSLLTPPGHVRPTYRNFWYADTRFQATAIRLARSPNQTR